MQFAQKRNDVYGIGDVYAYYGDLYFEQEKYIDAITYFNKGLKLSNQNSFYNLEKYCAEKLAESYIKLNNYKKAFEYNTVFQSLKDSTLNAKTNAKVESLKIEFETEKKEKEILTQRAELAEQELTIKTKDFVTIILGSSILVLGLISLGIYFYQSNKRKQLRTQLKLKDELSKTKTHNKLQEQRLRISRDLHDNIGSQLTFIISSIDNLKFLAKSSDEKLKYKLANINNFAANTISQLRDTIWAMNKNEIPYDDFHTRVLALIEKAKIAKDTTHFIFESKVDSNIVFSSVTGITIFRVLQEAINNAIKYSEASKVKIEIIEKNNQLEIEITDNGKGFDITTVEMGNGLENMQRRMDEIDGNININSKLGKGTSINIKIKNT
ncbi:MAG: sensor histidine kinase [Urechidicola sp.]|nr:sensor histidine kinase [Urechidicola sp.]